MVRQYHSPHMDSVLCGRSCADHHEPLTKVGARVPAVITHQPLHQQRKASTSHETITHTMQPPTLPYDDGCLGHRHKQETPGHKPYLTPTGFSKPAKVNALRSSGAAPEKTPTSLPWQPSSQKTTENKRDCWHDSRVSSALVF